MQVTLLCRRCGTEIHINDAFCQECGLAQENDQTTTDAASTYSPPPGRASSETSWPALEADPDANLENRAIFKVSSPEVIDMRPPAEIQQEVFNFAPDANEAAQNQVQASPKRLHSPIFDTDIAENKSAVKQYDFTPPGSNELGYKGGIGMVLTDIAIVLAVVGFATVLGCWGYLNFKKADKVQANKVSAELKAAASKHDFQSLYNVLTALKIHNSAALSEQQQSLYDEAVYRLGQNELSSGNTEKAMEYFKKVSIESSHYVSAREIIFVNASPVVTSPSQSDTPKPVEKPRKRSRAAVAAPPLSSERVLSIPVIEPQKTATGESDNSATVPTESSTETSTPKFSETDVSHYNRLLGAYFAKRKASPEPGAEAPSFKEWIKQDKPSF